MTVLIIHGSDLKSTTSGANFINNITGNFDASKFVSYHLKRFSFIDASNHMLARGLNKVLTKNILFNHIRLFIFKNLILEKKLREVTALIEQKDIEKIWVIMTNAEIIMLSELLYTTVPDKIVYLSILDEFDYMFKENLNLTPFSYKSLLRAFHKSINECRRVSVVTTVMRDDIRISIDKNTPLEKYFVLRSPGRDKHADAVRKQKRDKSNVNIAFAGNLYAKDEWNTFMRILKNNEITRLTNYKIHFLGHVPSGIHLTNNVIQYGYVGQSKLNEVLENCHYAYLPYPSNAKNSNVAFTSFPSKLSTYMELGLPILYHGPRQTAVESFILENEVGISLDNEGAFLSVLGNPEASDILRKNVDEVYARELSIRAQQNKLKVFLEL